MAELEQITEEEEDRNGADVEHINNNAALSQNDYTTSWLPPIDENKDFTTNSCIGVKPPNRKMSNKYNPDTRRRKFSM